MKVKFISLQVTDRNQYALTEKGLLYQRTWHSGTGFGGGYWSGWRFDSYVDEGNITDSERKE